MKSYLPTSQGRNKWRKLKRNIVSGQLVLVGDSVDLLSKGAYWLERAHRLHPQLRGEKAIVRPGTVAVLKRNAAVLRRAIVK